MHVCRDQLRRAVRPFPFPATALIADYLPVSRRGSSPVRLRRITIMCLCPQSLILCPYGRWLTSLMIWKVLSSVDAEGLGKITGKWLMASAR
jgi:hypothetical protein